MLAILLVATVNGTAQPSWGLDPASGTMLAPGISMETNMTLFNGVHPFPPYAPNGDPSTGFNPDSYVFRLFDVRQRPAFGNSNWNAPRYAIDAWKFRNLGSVFGLATDKSLNIYVTATSSFSSGYMIAGRNGAYAGPNTFQPLGIAPYGFGGAGAIYKIDGVTGAVSLFASLPQQNYLPVYDQTMPNPVVLGTDTFYYANPAITTGPGLGNIAYDITRNQFYVTNMEDGKIYRLSSSGSVLSTFDPMSADNGAPGFAPLGERLWGIGVKGDRVYYSVWIENNGQRDAIRQNEIRSVQLDASGNFIPASDRLEITMPPIGLPGVTFSNPVSDIEFSQNGKMLVSERTMFAASALRAHAARVLEFMPLSDGVWSAPREIYAGSVAPSPRNSSSGGSDYGYLSYLTGGAMGCDSMLWMGADAMRFSLEDGFPIPAGYTFYSIFGMQGTPVTGNSPANYYTTSNFIDVDNIFASATKAQMGDVDVFRVYPAVSGSAVSGICPDKPFTLTATVKDNPPFVVAPFTYQWYREDAPGNLVPVGSLGTIASGTGTFPITTTLTGSSTDIGKRFFIKLNYGTDGGCSVLDSTLPAVKGTNCCPTPNIILGLTPDKRVIGTLATLQATITNLTAPFSYRFFREDAPSVLTPISSLTNVATGVEPFIVSYSFNYAAIDIGDKKYILEIYKDDCSASADILPVELTNFSATLNSDQTVSIEWATASEVNSYGFDLERNYNGNWEKIGFAAGHGTTHESHKYAMKDNVDYLIEYEIPSVKYRLKMVDIDGSFDYSESKEVKLSQWAEYGVSVSQNKPNPFSSETTIEYSIKNDGNISLDVYDIQGNLVANLASGVKKAGKYQVVFNAKNLASGVYHYRFNANGRVIVKQLTYIAK